MSEDLDRLYDFYLSNARVQEGDNVEPADQLVRVMIAQLEDASVSLDGVQSRELPLSEVNLSLRNMYVAMAAWAEVKGDFPGKDRYFSIARHLQEDVGSDKN